MASAARRQIRPIGGGGTATIKNRWRRPLILVGAAARAALYRPKFIVGHSVTNMYYESI